MSNTNSYLDLIVRLRTDVDENGENCISVDVGIADKSNLKKEDPSEISDIELLAIYLVYFIQSGELMEWMDGVDPEDMGEFLLDMMAGHGGGESKKGTEEG